MAEFTTADAADLQQVNWLAKADYKYKKFCYDAVKTPLLALYGREDGYDEHYFEREDLGDDCDGSRGEWFSSHSHILKRYEAGGFIFHQPTDEFSYFDAREHSKQSARYQEFKDICTGKLENIKYSGGEFDQPTSVRALRRLVHKFKTELRDARPKTPREKDFIFAAIRRHEWFTGKTFDGWRIRVPNEIAVCSGCGAKLQFHFDLHNIEWFIEDRFIPIRFQMQCDAARLSNYDAECSQHRIEHRTTWRSQPLEMRTSWESETAIVREWLPSVLPKLICRDLRKLKG